MADEEKQADEAQQAADEAPKTDFARQLNRIVCIMVLLQAVTVISIMGMYRNTGRILALQLARTKAEYDEKKKAQTPEAPAPAGLEEKK